MAISPAKPPIDPPENRMTIIIAKELADPDIFRRAIPTDEPDEDPEIQKLHDEWYRKLIKAIINFLETGDHGTDTDPA